MVLLAIQIIVLRIVMVKIYDGKHLLFTINDILSLCLGVIMISNLNLLFLDDDSTTTTTTDYYSTSEFITLAYPSA